MKPATRRKPNAEHERRDTPKAATRDFHRSPVESVPCLLLCEGARLLRLTFVHEMACGDGALVVPLRLAGINVKATDIVDRGCPGHRTADYLHGPAQYQPGAGAISNPPFNLAEQFILKACEEFDFVAMVLRLRYLGAKHLIRVGDPGNSVRSPIWLNTRIPFARVIVPDGRWSMMHRDGYQGPKTEDGMIDFGWFIWDAAHVGNPQIIMEAQIKAAAAAGRN